VANVPVLVMVGGLPGTGKSTVASALVRRTGFAYLRVDRIEQAIVGSGELRAALGPVGCRNDPAHGGGGTAGIGRNVHIARMR
jgi:hypothetical protein